MKLTTLTTNLLSTSVFNIKRLATYYNDRPISFILSLCYIVVFLYICEVQPSEIPYWINNKLLERNSFHPNAIYINWLAAILSTGFLVSLPRVLNK